MNDIDKAQAQIDIADLFSQLRLLGFTEEELNEFKAVKHTRAHLETMIQIYGLVERETARTLEEITHAKENLQ